MAGLSTSKYLNGTLADIVDQIPEAGYSDAEQISSTNPGECNVRNIDFRYGNKVQNRWTTGLGIESGSFVGIVGQRKR